MDPLTTFQPYYAKQILPLRAWALALAVPILLGVWLPPPEFEATGHALLLLDLIHSRTPLANDEWLSIRPGTQALAYVLPRLSPVGASPFFGEEAFLLMNRWALVPLLLGVAAAAVPKDGRRPLGSVALILCVLSPPLLAWAATLHFLTPSLAFGALGLAVGTRGKPGAALALAVLAYSLRAEGALLALVGVAAGLSQGRTEWRWVVWLALAALVPCWLWSRPWGGLMSHQLFQQPTLSGAVEDGSVGSHLFANAHALFLGGPWSAPLSILGILVLAGWVAKKAESRWGAALHVPLLVVAYLGLLLVPLALIDFGDRSRLPAAVLAPVLLIRCVAALPSRGRLGVLSVASLWLLASSVGGFQALDARWMKSVAGPPGSIALADEGADWTLQELRESGCVVVWGGVEPPLGVRSGDERPDLDHALLGGLYDGGCVFWLPVSEGFYADARQERLDRAREMLNLEVVGWLSDPPHPNVIVWRSEAR